MREEAAEAHQRFMVREGDHLTLLAVYRSYCEVPRSERVHWCRSHFVNPRAMRKALDIHKQVGGYGWEHANVGLLEVCVAWGVQLAAAVEGQGQASPCASSESLSAGRVHTPLVVTLLSIQSLQTPHTQPGPLAPLL
jgi:hypothetical protein